MNFTLDTGVRTISENIGLEKAHRKEMVKNAIPFGITYLDRALDGIFSNDLILVTARTGGGKTELLTHIATNAVLGGKRVLFFALEASRFEIERRIKFKLISEEYFSQPVQIRGQHELTYHNWFLGKNDDIVSEIEPFIENKMRKAFENFHVFYRKKEFTVDTFERVLLSHQNQTDLVVIDHLNYFDFEELSNENAAISRIVKQISDLRDLAEKPILLAVHLKKRDTKERASILPDLEDIHGSSNITKIATNAIVMAPSNLNSANHKEFGTYMRVAKHRSNGSATRYVGHVKYLIEQNTYKPEMSIGLYKPHQENFVGLNRGEMPQWALG